MSDTALWHALDRLLLSVQMLQERRQTLVGMDAPKNGVSETVVDPSDLELDLDPSADEDVGSEGDDALRAEGAVASKVEGDGDLQVNLDSSTDEDVGSEEDDALGAEGAVASKVEGDGDLQVNLDPSTDEDVGSEGDDALGAEGAVASKVEGDDAEVENFGAGKRPYFEHHSNPRRELSHSRAESTYNWAYAHGRSRKRPDFTHGSHPRRELSDHRLKSTKRPHGRRSRSPRDSDSSD